MVSAAFWVSPVQAAPRPPAPGDLYGWELPRLLAIDTIPFPQRLIRNRSYGRVVAEITLRRDGTKLGIDHTFVENGDLVRWADKILGGARFGPAQLDGSPIACRLPVHVLFTAASGGHPPRYEVWLPTDSANYQRCLQDHFLLANESAAPVLLRAGSYDRMAHGSAPCATEVFQVYVHKDGSREDGQLVLRCDDDQARRALAALVDLQILPARFKQSSYGCWVRIQAAFIEDWDYPTRPVDLYRLAYLGWPAPWIAPAGESFGLAPQFTGIDLSTDAYAAALLQRSSRLLYGHALYAALVDTSGRVGQWLRVRAPQVESLRLDPNEPYRTPSDATLPRYSLAELARLAAVELEKVLPYMTFLPGRGYDGRLEEMWIAVGPRLFR